MSQLSGLTPRPKSGAGKSRPSCSPLARHALASASGSAGMSATLARLSSSSDDPPLPASSRSDSTSDCVRQTKRHLPHHHLDHHWRASHMQAPTSQRAHVVMHSRELVHGNGQRTSCRIRSASWPRRRASASMSSFSPSSPLPPGGDGGLAVALQALRRLLCWCSRSRSHCCQTEYCRCGWGRAPGACDAAQQQLELLRGL